MFGCKSLTAEVVADRLVLAVPLAVARELLFEPALPRGNCRHGRRAGLGQAAKLHIPLLPRRQHLVRFKTSFIGSGPGRRRTSLVEVQPMVHAFSGSGPALDIFELT